MKWCSTINYPIEITLPYQTLFFTISHNHQIILCHSCIMTIFIIVVFVFILFEFNNPSSYDLTLSPFLSWIYFYSYLFWLQPYPVIYIVFLLSPILENLKSNLMNVRIFSSTLLIKVMKPPSPVHCQLCNMTQTHD